MTPVTTESAAATVHLVVDDQFGRRHELTVTDTAAADLVRQVGRATNPGPTWLLDLAPGVSISRGRARTTPRVEAEEIVEAYVLAQCGPHKSAPEFVFGLDGDGRLVSTSLNRRGGLVGERAAAIAWLSGAPRARWRRVKATALEVDR